MMKSIFKNGAKTFLRLAVVIIIDFFICFSMSVLCTAVFTENIGYEVFGVKEGAEESEHLYTYYYADGEDNLKEDFESEGYTLVAKSLRSTLSGKGKAVFLITSQLLSVIMLVAFVCKRNYSLGSSEANLVRFGHIDKDTLKGFKIGIIAVLPLVLVYVAGALSNMPVSLYRILNSYAFGFIDLIVGAAKTMGELTALKHLLLVLLLAIIPILVGVSYILGFKGINISERLIFKKEK